MQPNRLPEGGLIDRGTVLPFRFDGRLMHGHPGDTLASALLANGVRLVGRSFKYHRPRGILSAGSEEPNALVELRTGARREPNTRATTVELFAGLEAASQNRFPSVRYDLGAVNGLLGPLFSAGFYYKTFMWPAKAWERLYEPAIRRAAGLGRASGEPDPDTYEREHLFCDVLVIGGGPAGISAALAAARAGARVVLCEEDAWLGGRLLAERAEIDGAPALAWLAETQAEMPSHPELRVLRRTAVCGVFDHGTYMALERVADHKPVPAPGEPRQRLWRIVARRAVLAAGAIERPLVFSGNDIPGVMLGGAVRGTINRFGVRPGRRMAVFTASDDGWRTAAIAARAGIEVAAVIDPRGEPPTALRRAAEAAGAQILAGGRVLAAEGAARLRRVQVLDGQGRRQTLELDLLAVSGGWNPTVNLACHLGARPEWDATLAAFVPARLPPGMVAAGAASGRLGLADALADGARCGAEAAEASGFAPVAVTLPRAEAEPAAQTLWVDPAPGGHAFVDFQHDVTAADVAQAHREGFRSVELLKRYTTLGMGTDQGKTANANGLALMAALTGVSIPGTGTTVYRPPYVPVAIGALAGAHRGRDFRPTRLTPAHGWAQARGAVFVEAGPWLRAQYFPAPGETDWLQSAAREALTVRRAVGVCDVSTLGKIELIGRDAGAFLDRLYVNTVSTLPVGRVRYGLMLREDGFALDDGTIARLGPARFVITATTANAPRVLQHMEFCAQVLWPELDVQFVDVTDQWAQFAIAGPRAREVVQAVADPGADLSNAGFPHLSAAAIRAFGGVRARLFRVSYSGELGYEIGVPARAAAMAADAILRAGAPHGIAPYGTEALSILRIEKGHVAGGELNGQTTARDLGLGRMVSGRKDFIGRVLAARPALTAPDRPALVGLRPVDRAARLRAGAHLLPQGAPAEAAHDQGWISSAAFSPTLGHWIGLGFLAGGPSRAGERIRAHDPVRGPDTEVEVVPPCFIDPEGDRLRA